MAKVAPVVGVDGCRGGWVGVVLEPGGLVGAVFGAHIGEVVAAASTLPGVAAAGGLAAVGVDMPLHLSDEGHRPCDLAVRRDLGRKASSLFITPPRAALAADSYADGVAVARAVTGSAFSRQAWALRAKVLELDGWWPSAPAPVREVHPELSFSLMARAPILAGKRTWAGAAARRSVLAAEGIELPDDLGPAGRAAGTDDVLDAAAVAWTARRIAAGVARPYPDPPVDLGRGRLQAIWA
jgi:predicted RNase H-like nuclease